uniref:N(4)-(beta-N-acetylglucosaminyl)-L-asparaginase n=1 Tax=Lygus hesperus TaxID=30085 RepID=A0A0K8SGT2_LYGHE
MKVSLLILGLVPYCFSQDVSTNLVRDKTKTPLVINTWAFSAATEAAWRALKSGRSALDALEIGCSTCEELQCDGTVGFGGSPDENGETTLDAMVFNGDTMEMGSVAGLRRIKKAASVARKVMEHTGHSIIAGDLATEFAKTMGFKEETLTTNVSSAMWREWKASNCQPNFWKNCSPDPLKSCGPYKPLVMRKTSNAKRQEFGRFNHDTISMIIVDSKGSVVAGTSSNGAKFKIPGRVGDAPLPGAGAYADSRVGAAVATGDGDVMMRFLPASTIVEMMRNGVHPQVAAKKLILRIARFYPEFSGALIAVSKDGEYGAACHNIAEFPFSIAKGGSVKVLKTPCS